MAGPKDYPRIDLHADLQRGITVADGRAGRSLTVSFDQTTRSIKSRECSTKPNALLAAQGMRFLAAHQDSTTTARRISVGETIVAVEAAHVVGIITLKQAELTRGAPFYERPDVEHVRWPDVNYRSVVLAKPIV